MVVEKADTPSAELPDKKKAVSFGDVAAGVEEGYGIVSLKRAYTSED